MIGQVPFGELLAGVVVAGVIFIMVWGCAFGFGDGNRGRK